MDNFFSWFTSDTFSTIVTSLGPAGGWVLILIVLLWSLHKVGIMPLILSGIKNKVEKKKIKMQGIKEDKELKQHPVFQDIKGYLRRKLPALDFGCEDRNFIFSEVILKEKLTAIHKHLINPILSDTKLNDLTKLEYIELAKLQPDDIVDEYNAKIKLRLQERYGPNKGAKIYQHVMYSPIKGFNKIHEHVVVMLLNIINGIAASDIYDNNLEKYWAVLGCYSGALASTFVDIEKVHYMHNGDLTELLNEPYN